MTPEKTFFRVAKESKFKTAPDWAYANTLCRECFESVWLTRKQTEITNKDPKYKPICQECIEFMWTTGILEERHGVCLDT